MHRGRGALALHSTVISGHSAENQKAPAGRSQRGSSQGGNSPSWGLGGRRASAELVGRWFGRSHFAIRSCHSFSE